MQVHGGPYFYESGTLLKHQRDEIFDKTGCSAGIRGREQWGRKRGLTLSGPSSGIQQAYNMADEFIRASQGRKNDGDRQEMPDTDVSARRKAATKRTREMVEAGGNYSQEDSFKDTKHKEPTQHTARKGARKQASSGSQGSPAPQQASSGSQGSPADASEAWAQSWDLAKAWYQQGVRDQWADNNAWYQQGVRDTWAQQHVHAHAAAQAAAPPAARQKSSKSSQDWEKEDEALRRRAAQLQAHRGAEEKDEKKRNENEEEKAKRQQADEEKEKRKKEDEKRKKDDEEKDRKKKEDEKRKKEEEKRKKEDEKRKKEAEEEEKRKKEDEKRKQEAEEEEKRKKEDEKRKQEAEEKEKRKKEAEKRKQKAEEQERRPWGAVSLSEDSSSSSPPRSGSKAVKWAGQTAPIGRWRKASLFKEGSDDDDDDKGIDETDLGKGLSSSARGSRQPPRPRLRLDRRYTFLSIGRKTTQGHDFWEYLGNKHNLDKLNTVVVNVENLAHPPEEICADHCGLNGDIWETVVTLSPEELERIWGEVARKINNFIDEDEEEVNVVLQCKWGKHRSVAAAEISQYMVLHDERGQALTEHLAKPNWGKRKCGRQWCKCHGMNAQKHQVLREALPIWKKIWG